MISGQPVSVSGTSSTNTRSWPSLDRQRDPGHARDQPGARTGGVDDHTGGDRSTGREAHRMDPSTCPLEPGHLVGDELGPQCARATPEGLQQAVAVEPSFPAQPERTGREVGGIEPGEPFGQQCRFEQGDIGARRPLDAVIGLQDVETGRTGEIKVTALVQSDRRLATQELKPELRHGDVERCRELLADRTRGKRRRCRGIGWVTFDHQHTAASILAAQEERDGGADHPAADDDDRRRSGRTDQACGALATSVLTSSIASVKRAFSRCTASLFERWIRSASSFMLPTARS